MVGIATKAMAAAAAMLASSPEPKVTRRRGPRKAATYRAARRNEVLRGDVHSTWKGAEAKYQPYANPSFRAVVNSWGQRVYVPAKTYKANGDREVARRKRQREAREASS